MSKYTSIILFIPGSEIQPDRIKEVNSYRKPDGNSITLRDVNGNEFPDMFPRFTYCGTYNYFPTKNFIEFLKHNVNWEFKEDVRVIIKEEDSASLDYYTLEN